MKMDRKTLVIVALSLVILAMAVSSYSAATYDAGQRQGEVNTMNYILGTIQQFGAYVLPLPDTGINLVCVLQQQEGG